MNTRFSHSGAIFEEKHGILTKHQLDIIESANKQLEFYNSIFKTPQILNISQHSFEMEYISNAMPLPQYFSLIDENQIYGFINKIIDFVRRNITYHIDYDVCVFTSKVNNIILKLSNQEYLEAALNILRYLNNQKTIRVIGGAYHGDLTFSNILVQPNNLYLIDFLPGYIHSPELDYVKLIQEYKLHWSRLLAPDLISDNYFIACDYLKSQLMRFYKPRTPIIEAINYLRILPYVKNDAIGTILCNEINNVLQ